MRTLGRLATAVVVGGPTAAAAHPANGTDQDIPVERRSGNVSLVTIAPPRPAT